MKTATSFLIPGTSRGVPKAKCPTCATIVTYAEGYDPICPQCGFRGAAPARAKPAAWTLADPALAAAPAPPPGASQQQGLAVGALVCGLVCFVFPPLSIVAIILGAIGMNQAERSPQTHGGKGMAVAGLVLGLIVAVFWLVILGSFGFWDW